MNKESEQTFLFKKRLNYPTDYMEKCSISS